MTTPLAQAEAAAATAATDAANAASAANAAATAIAAVQTALGEIPTVTGNGTIVTLVGQTITLAAGVFALAADTSGNNLGTVVTLNGSQSAAGYSANVTAIGVHPTNGSIVQANTAGNWFQGTVTNGAISAWTQITNPFDVALGSGSGSGAPALTSKGGPIKALAYASYSSLSGTDGPFSAAGSGFSWFEQPAAITQVQSIATLGATSIDVQLGWGYNINDGQGGSTAPNVIGLTETRKGYTAVVVAAAEAGLDVWTKFNILAQGGDNRVVWAGGNSPATFFANLQTMVFAAVDAANAALTASGKKPMFGIILTSEMNALSQPAYDSHWASLYAAAKARYPGMLVGNMSTGFGVLTAVSQTYLNTFDFVCTDTYTPIGDGTNLPTYSQVVSRLTETAYGGNNNWFGTQPPPGGSTPYVFSAGQDPTETHNGLAGVTGSVMGFLKSISQQAGGKYVVVGEDGFASVPGCSADPGGASGGTLTQAGMDESIVDWHGLLAAYYSSANASWYGGSFLWSYGPYDDVTTVGSWYPPGVTWDVNQKEAILGYIAATFGGSVPALVGSAPWLEWSNDNPSWND